jgi:hypothetical protein
MRSACAAPGNEKNLMRLQSMKRKLTSLLLLALLGMACLQARAQNQTPANVALPVGWTDPATRLTWTKEDNGSDVNWNQAIAYCSNLRLGEYSDWRLPTIDELQGIYDSSIEIPGQWPKYGQEATWHVKGNLKLSGEHWSSSQKNAKEVWSFSFDGVGLRRSWTHWDSADLRALCVRR